jgi:hypothetical protein
VTLISLIFLNKVIKLLEIEESVTDALLVLLLIDEVMSLHPLVFELLFLILTHKLGQGAVEFANILWKELTVTENLHEQLFLILFANEATLDPEPLISNLLAAVVEDLLGPNSPLLLLFVTLDLQVALLQS